MERDLAAKLGSRLGADVVCCDRSEQQIRSHVGKIRGGVYAAVVHFWSFAPEESPFAPACEHRKVPLAVVTHLRPTSCIRALFEALGESA